MSKEQLARTFYELDKDMEQIHETGCSFQFIIKEKDSFLCTGIGSGSDMTEMCLYQLLGLFQSSYTKDINTYAESVKNLIIKAYNENIYDMQPIERKG